MKLVIAEKKSLGKFIADALNATNTKNGYIENDQYIVTWAYGHLLGLKNVNDYLGEKTAWKDINLPFVPKRLEFELKDDIGAKKQFKIIKELLQRTDITEVIHCGDPDREGQVIVNLILEKAGNKKPVKRLWLPELVESELLKNLENMKDNSEYENMYQEGLARTYFDWLLGINTTILLSVKSGSLFKSGRVLIPMVKAVYDRDMAIENFKTEKYYMLESNTMVNGKNLKLIAPKKFSANEINEANESIEYLNSHIATVKKIESKELIKTPPKLFSLSTLQGTLLKGSSMDFEDSMKIIQSLYEKGFISYPRTNTEYLSEMEKNKIDRIIVSLGEKGSVLENKDTKSIYDSSKIDSHSAIIITEKTPDLDALSDDEKTVYLTVYNRFLSKFLKEPCIVNQVKVVIEVDTIPFELTGEIIVKDGFNLYEKVSLKSELPMLSQGQTIDTDFRMVEKETTPPKKLNQDSLSTYLKNVFKKYLPDMDNEHMNDSVLEDDSEQYKALLDGLEIGTEATRTGIMSNAVKVGYLEKKGKLSTLSITQKGKDFIKLLDSFEINLYKEKTVEINRLQKQIYSGEKTMSYGLNLIHSELFLMVENANKKDISSLNIVSEKEEKEPLGICPRCGKNIYEGKSNFYCASGKDGCGFTLWANDKFFTNKGKTLTKSTVKSLLNNGFADVKGLKPKDSAKKPYDAKISLVDTGTYINYKIEF